jgi:hypothetical protein
VRSLVAWGYIAMPLAAVRRVIPLAWVCLASGALAQPVNDERWGAIVILPNTTVIADCAAATTAPDDPLLGCRTNAGCVETFPTQGAGSVWFTFYSTGEPFTLTTADPATDGEGDTILNLFVRVPSGGQFVHETCNDDIDCENGVLTSQIHIPSPIPGAQYLVQVAAWGPAAQRPYTLTFESDPGGDEPDTAPVLGCQGAAPMVFRALTSAPNDPPAPCLDAPTTGPTFWARFVAEDRPYAISIAPFNLSVFRDDTVMTVFLEHPDGTLEPVACNDDATSATRLSRVVLATPIVGATYLVQVALKVVPTFDLPYTLSLECAPPGAELPPPCIPGATLELESCDQYTNDNCASPNLQTISLGEAVCGDNAYLTWNVRDLDVYRLVIPRRTRVSVVVLDSVPIAVQIAASCDALGNLPSVPTSSNSQLLQPGVHFVRVSRPSPLSCEYARYTFVVAATPSVGDADADGVVDFADVTAVLANFGNDYRPFPGFGLGNVNGDGVVTFYDIQLVLLDLRLRIAQGL